MGRIVQRHARISHSETLHVKRGVYQDANVLMENFLMPKKTSVSKLNSALATMKKANITSTTPMCKNVAMTGE